MRQNERHDIALPAKVRVAPEHAEVVVYAKGVRDEDGWLPVELVDFSMGGFGFASPYFFPRGVKLEIEITSPAATEQRVLLSCVIRVMRVQMTDRRPAYMCGAAFMDLDDTVRDQIKSLLRELGEADLGGEAC